MLLDQISIHAFIQNNAIKTEAGEILDFSKYRFMYDIYADRSPLVCCMKCLDPKTRVLTSDLRWKEIKDIQVGEGLFSVDEFSDGKKGRRFRTAIVEKKWKTFQEAYKITLEDGREITASSAHKFLTRKYTYNTDTAWKEVSEMKAGDLVRHIVTPWGESDIDDGWFGGIIDGEGHVRTQSGVQIDIVQNPGEISDKIEEYLLKNNVKFRKDLRDKKGFSDRHINCFEVSGSEDSLRLFGKCRPVKFLRNKAVFENKKVGGVGKSWVKIVSIEPVGTRSLVDIQTSTRTFIAEGVVTHNCAQIGFTTYEIIKTAHQCRYEGKDILYVLPTADDVKRFSGGKTNKILGHNPVMASWTKDKDSVEQKQFGKNTVYYQGSWTERAALMITAKKLVVDEYDRCKQDIVEQYDSRLQSTANPEKAFFSNPSLPDFGIDKWYKKSDQKKWHITHSCGKNYIMDETCINYSTELYECPHCGGEITDEERRMGEWKATATGEWSGYWIPLWIAPWMPASKIAQMKREKTPEFFANFVAGLPYVNTNDMLSQKILESNLVEIVNPREDRTIIGLDTGHNLHYTMMNKQGIFYHGYCPSVAEMNNQPGYDPYDEIERHMLEDKRAILISDQGGDLIGIRKLQAKFPGRVYLCWFVKETKNKQLIRWGENEEAGKVPVDRNRVVQLAVDQFKDQRLTVNGTVEDWQPWFNHWLNIYRVREDMDENEPMYGWKWVWKRKGPDHWAMATIYALVGMDRFAQDLAQIVSKDSRMAGIETGSRADGVITAGNFYRPNI